MFSAGHPIRFHGPIPPAAVLFLVLSAGSPLAAQTFSHIPALSFTKVYGGANPLPQIMVVTSTGAALAFDAAASTTTGGSWLSISSCGSWCTTPESVTVTVNPVVTLAAGTYSGQIVVSVHGNSSNSMTVPISLTIAATGSDFFDDIPGHLSFSLATGSSTALPPSCCRSGTAARDRWPGTRA